MREETPLTEQRFETPYLQLVMQRLWEEERRAGQHTMRRSTLDAWAAPTGSSARTSTEP